MSTYFLIYTKPKNLPDADPLCLFSLCTTPARELNEEMGFNYDTVAPVDCQFIDKLINVYKDKIAKYQDFIRHSEDEKKSLMNALPQANNNEIYQYIKEDIFNLNNYIDETQEDIELCESSLSSLATIYNIIDDYDNNVYEFYYIYA